MDVHKKQSNTKPSKMQQFWTLLGLPKLVDLATPYTETTPDNGATSGQTLPADTQLKDTYHQTCSTLLYNIFVQIIVTGNLSLLIISGNPSPIELATAWQGILYEYIDLTTTDKATTIHELWKRILYTECKIRLVDWSVYALKYKYSEILASQLVELGYDYIQPLEDREDYLKQIYAVETDAKFLIVHLNQLNNEYQLLCPEAIKKTPELIDYEKELAILSKFMGQRLDKNKITVLEFAAIVNLYNETHKTSKDAPSI